MTTKFSLIFLLIPIFAFSASHDQHPPPPPPLEQHHHHHHPQSPPPPLQHQSPQPPPPHQHQLNNIIDALIGAGDFNNWANMLSASSDLIMFPVSATLFVPSDDSLFPLPTPLPLPLPIPTSSTLTATAASAAFDPFVVPYHIVPQRLSFSQLTLFKPFSRLPTLLPSKSILITNNSISNFTLDASRISHHDLYLTSAIAVHGIAALLNYTNYGGGGGGGDAIGPPSPSTPLPPLRSDAAGCFFGVSAFVLLLIPWVVNLGHSLI